MKIEPKTIKAYQQFLCPTGIDNSDKEWCAKDPKPIDYGKFLKTFNFGAYNFWKKPVEPRFAEAIKPVLESGTCYDVLADSKERLSAFISERKTDAGAWPPLPDEAEIYRMLIADPYGQPSDAKSRLTEQTKKRAQKIRSGIKKARELDDQGKTDEAQRTRLDLASEIDRVCIDDEGPDKPLQMKTEGQAVIDRYDNAQASWIKAKAWLGGKIALAAAAAWGLAKTGVLGKMRRAFKQTWAATKPPQDGGPVRRFFRNAAALPGRLLKSVWAAIRIKENPIPDTTTPPVGGTTPAGTASATGAGNETQPAGSSTPPEAPKESLAIKDDAQETDIKTALGRAENAARLMAQAAGDQITDANAWLLNLRNELDSAETDIRARFGWLAFMLRSQRTLDFVSSLVISYMRRVFDETVPYVLPKFTETASLIDKQDTEGARRLLTRIRADLSVVQTERDELVAIRAALSIALGDIERLIETPPGNFQTTAERLLSNTDGLARDSSIILDALLAISGMAATPVPETMAVALKRRGLITSGINGLLSSAQWINSHEAARRGGVRLITSGLGRELDVPAELQGTILRILDKAGNNGIRHAHMDSPKESVVTFGAELSQNGVLTLYVRDNGAGMTSSRVRHVTTNGKKGSGISEMMRICEENGWIFGLSSEPDHGTTVKFVINTAQWKDEMGSPELSGAGTPPGAAPDGGVTSSMAAAAAGLSQGAYVSAPMPLGAMSAATFATAGAMAVFAPLL